MARTLREFDSRIELWGIDNFLRTGEYGEAFGLPIWINRCGVLAGAGQFGRPDQGIFAFWLNSYLRRRPLKYIGFDVQGHQVRDCLHPRDVAALVWKQMQSPDRQVERVQNVGGGVASAMSLAQLSSWCAARFGKRAVGRDSTSRPYDVPWMVLDSASAKRQWDWQPKCSPRRDPRKDRPTRGSPS